MTPLKKKLQMRFGLLAIIPLLCLGLFSGLLISQQVFQDFDSRTTDSLRGIESKLTANTNLKISTIRRYLATYPQSAITRDSIKNIGYELKRLFNFTRVEVYDERGMPVVSTEVGDLYNEGMIKTLLSGTFLNKSSQSLEKSRMGINSNIYLPLRLREGKRVLLVLSQLIDHTTLTEIKEQIGLDVTLYSEGKFHSTTVFDFELLQRKTLLDKLERHITSNIHQPKSFILSDHSIGMISLFDRNNRIIGAIVTSSNITGLREKMANLFVSVFSLALILLLGIILLVRRTSHGMVRPINTVLQKFEELSNGRYSYIDDQANDEFNKLYQGYNFLAKKLHETVISKNHFTSVLENLSESVIILDNGTRIQFINNTALRILSTEESAVLGKLWSEISTTAIQDLIAEEVNEVRDIDIELISPCGQVPVNISITRTSLRSGTFLISMRDLRDSKIVEQLRSTQERLIHASRLIGRSEVATSVLHNIGNVLNSLNIAFRQMQDTINHSEVQKLLKLVEIVEEKGDKFVDYIAHDEGGKNFFPYFIKLASVINGERAELIDDSKKTGELLEHIENIITTQQSAAKGSDQLNELVNIEQLVKNSIAIVAGPGSEASSKIRFEYESSIKNLIRIDKHRVQAIIVNLCQNSKHAVLSAPKDERKFIKVTAHHLKGQVVISVADNGIGISEQDKSRIFKFGFTTKKHGHGFGLHSSFVAAKEMQGSLTFKSKLGQGTEFTLAIPAMVAESNLTGT